MSELLRAPELVGSWEWFVDTGKKTELSECLYTLAAVAEILHRHGLLKVETVEVCWEHPQSRRPDTCRAIPVYGAIDTPDYTQRLLGSRPQDSHDAQVKLLRGHGGGTWIDARGDAHREIDLASLETMPLFDDVSVEVAVHHDLWAYYAFSGTPHQDVYDANAPRLAVALEEVETVLRTETENGEGTYFGASEGFWIKHPDPEDLVAGLAMDATDRL